MSSSLPSSGGATTSAGLVAAAGGPSAMDSVTQSQLAQLVDRALEEDVGEGDLTTLSTIPAASRSTANFLAKESGVLSGVAVASFVFHRIDPELKVEWTKADGDRVEKGDYFGRTVGRSARREESKRDHPSVHVRPTGWC